MRRIDSGFTLIELVAIVVILGVIAASATSRFSNAGASALAGRDDFVAALFYAQQVAMARASSTNSVQLQVNASGTQVTVNQTQAPVNLLSVAMPNNVVIAPAPATLSYTKLGTTTASNFTVTSTDGSNATVIVEATGYAR